MTRYNSKSNKLILLFIPILIMSIFPIVLLTLMSISSGWTWPDILPKSISLKAWKYVLTENPKTFLAISNSFKIALVSMAISLILSIPAGDALGRYNFKGKKLIEFFLILPIIVPSIIFSMGIHKHFILLNLADSMSGVIICHVILTIPYMIRATKISFEHLGFELEEQAKMLGARRLSRLLYVVLPFILPGIVAGGTITILISLSEYTTTALIGGGNIVTIPVLMFPFVNGSNQNIGAVYSILFAIMAVISILIMDYFLKKYYDGRKGY